MKIPISEQGIPALDLHQFTRGDRQDQLAFAAELGKIYEDIGFVAIRNHGISDSDIQEAYLQIRKFFELPEAIKLQYDDSAGGGQRGYTAFGKEHAKNRKAADLKEFWHFGQNVPENDPLHRVYPPNKIVPELPGYNAAGYKLYQSLENCGITLLRAISLFLELEEGYFTPRVTGGNSILRAIHYPPITDEPEDGIRAGEHEDINLITLLIGASADGLEVLNRSGAWVPVTKVDEHIVVNVGDMLQRLTNNRLKSTTHRVVNPPRELWHTSRYSIPFFLHPRPEVRLDCLDSCITANNPKHYADCTANEFLMERLQEIGLIKTS
jgi:isopenicillin N synthase-like dioxygenase